jgi:ParB family chromosome partitioning protein
VSRKALGKGLDAIIPDLKAGGLEVRGHVVEIDVGEIGPSPYQPRSTMKEESLEDLRQSIAEKGVLQPVIVRRHAGEFQLVAGERRWRAAKLAGLETVPAVVMRVSDSEALEIALIENLQREDLNAVDEAKGYRELLMRFNLTHEDLARRIGKSRATITNSLRLLNLPDEVKRGLEEGKITVGHARAVLGIEDPRQIINIYRSVMHRGLSVRQVEALVRRKLRVKSKRKPVPTRPAPEITGIEDRLMRKLGTRVRIINHGGHGKIEIEFYSDDDLGRIVEALG